MSLALVVKSLRSMLKDGDKVKKVMFGDPNMEIRKDNPKARKSFLELDTSAIQQQTRLHLGTGLVRCGRSQ